MVLAVVVAAVVRMRPEGLVESMGTGVLWRASLIAGVLQVCLHFDGAGRARNRLGSDGPVLYSQVRVGRDGRHFTLHKFRSMRTDAETGPVWSTENDPRVTRVGRFLRRTRLDELPQLWNVLKGDMSIVGPRRTPPRSTTRVQSPLLAGWPVDRVQLR